MQGWKRRSGPDERMEERIVFYKYHREGEGHEGGGRGGEGHQSD